MELTDLNEVENALKPYYAVAAETTGKGITVARMERLMKHLGNPERQLCAVHVAGTSGKTSTTYFTAALLTAAGQKVGVTVSPHVLSLTERVQINGAPLSEAVFCQHMSEFLPLVKDAPETPSWFELMVAFAFWVFARENVDYAVIETGMGGLHDATNVLTGATKLCVITDIGLDHQKFLGDSVLAIAAQKAGIIHEGNTVLMYEQAEEVMQPIRFKVSQLENGELYAQQQNRLATVYGHAFAADFPAYQHRNWLLAYAAYRFLASRDSLPLLSPKQLAETQLTVPGRMQRMTVGGVTVLFDGAHNEQKMKAFVSSFKAEFGNRSVPVLLALKKDKDFHAVTPLVTKIASKIIVTSFSLSQDWPIEAIHPEEILTSLRKAHFTEARSVRDPKKAFAELLKTGSNLVVVTGSFYVISQIQKELTHA